MTDRTRYPFHAVGEKGLTPAQREAQAKAVAAYQARIERKQRTNRIYRIAYVCSIIALTFALFYSLTR